MHSPYRTKLACVNCGMKKFYILPFGAEWTNYEWDGEESSDRIYSYYTVRGKEFEKTCSNCGLAMLIGEFWDKPNPTNGAFYWTKEEDDGFNSNSRAS